MKNLNLIKNRIFYIILILFISFGVVGVTLAAANHMEGYLQDIQYIPPQIQGGGQYVDSSPPLPARIASDPVNSATPGDRIIIGPGWRRRDPISQSLYRRAEGHSVAVTTNPALRSSTTSHRRGPFKRFPPAFAQITRGTGQQHGPNFPSFPSPSLISWRAQYQPLPLWWRRRSLPGPPPVPCRPGSP